MAKCKYCKKEHENENTGCNNSGDRNSGYMNSGNWNSGDSNSGNSNSGDWNSGNWNSGNWNSGNRNSGFFNTGEPNKIMVFNKWLDMKPSEFLEKYNIYADIPLNRWIEKEDMTDEEKKEIKGWEQMGGYLKTLDFKEACKMWWSENEDRHEDFTSLPNFDKDVFEEITGIKTEEPQKEKNEEIIELNGKKYKLIKE